MIDICFVGNSSVDHIVTKNGCHKTFGGSAIYSSYSCRHISDVEIAIISNVNKKLRIEVNNKDINVIGDNNPLVEFEIDEINGTCSAKKYYDNNFSVSETVNINHLHISFRKGVDVDKILNNPKIQYNTLSIDVMIHSVKEYIPLVKKYLDKIDMLFCNMAEYSVIEDIVKNIPIKIITNEDKPVIVMNKKENLIYEVHKAEKVISTTGAGDTFIGGFLGSYVKNKNLDLSISQGISNSFASIKKIGPLGLRDKVSLLDIKRLKLPNNIIVIGNSCAGKTTFINFLKKNYNIFTDIDDLSPLLEVFMMDDVANINDIEKFKKIESKITFMKDIYNEYLSDFNNIKHYSRLAMNGTGHDIIRPILWDLILEKAVLKLQKNNNIIQFSRGFDYAYEEEIDKDVYKRSIGLILNILPNCNNTIIINLTSELDVRKQRNLDRYANGGHFVSEATMEQVYGQDIFAYKHIKNNCGYIEINDILYPVVTVVNDKFLEPIELDEFLLYNLNRVIKYYNNFKEVQNNGHETNTEGYLAK